MEGPEVTFIFQFGLVRDTVTATASSLGLKTLKDLACDFINRKVGTASVLRPKIHKVVACNCLDRKVGTASVLRSNTHSVVVCNYFDRHENASFFLLCRDRLYHL
jgi:hypothetical protein